MPEPTGPVATDLRRLRLPHGERGATITDPIDDRIFVIDDNGVSLLVEGHAAMAWQELTADQNREPFRPIQMICHIRRCLWQCHLLVEHVRRGPGATPWTQTGHEHEPLVLACQHTQAASRL